MTNKEKIAKAKQLLFEVKQDELAKMRKKNDKKQEHLCLCKHKRGVHGVSHSINFTDGGCMECDCMGFQYSISQNEPKQSVTG